MESLNKKKYDFLLYLLETGDAMVCLDARLPEVDVPKNQKNNSSLNLIFNLNFRRPIEVNEDAISATLAFSGRPYKCYLPFEAVWAIYDPNMKNGQVWEESIPPDMNLADQIVSGITDQPPKIPEPKPEKKFKSIKTGGKTSAEGRPGSGSTPKTPRDRSHLRVIK
ncbi:MAG: ClpXP protease specificity-enhancing factor SspB [Nitrospinota bacterium]